MKFPVPLPHPPVWIGITQRLDFLLGGLTRPIDAQETGRDPGHYEVVQRIQE